MSCQSGGVTGAGRSNSTEAPLERRPRARPGFHSRWSLRPRPHSLNSKTESSRVHSSAGICFNLPRLWPCAFSIRSSPEIVPNSNFSLSSSGKFGPPMSPLSCRRVKYLKPSSFDDYILSPRISSSICNISPCSSSNC